SDLRMDYTAVGQTTHLAARLDQMAEPGPILLAPGTLRPAGGYGEGRSGGPVPIKGLTEPMETNDPLRAGNVRSPPHAPPARGLTVFVGRETEVDQLRQALALAESGRGQVVAIVGEPGMGKSRLTWEFIHSADAVPWRLLEGGSVSYGKATAFLPIVALLTGY